MDAVHGEFILFSFSFNRIFNNYGIDVYYISVITHAHVHTRVSLYLLF